MSARNWVLLELLVEMGPSNDEKSEEEDLNHKATDDDVLASLHTLQATTALNSTT
jgi:hypothetical protein